MRGSTKELESPPYGLRQSSSFMSPGVLSPSEPSTKGVAGRMPKVCCCDTFVVLFVREWCVIVFVVSVTGVLCRLLRSEFVEPASVCSLGVANQEVVWQMLSIA